MRLPLRAFALLVGGILPSCSSQPSEPAVLAAQEFLAAVDRSDCSAAWSYFSTGAKAYIEMQSAEMIAETPYRNDHLAPQNLYCRPNRVHRFLTYQSETATLKSQSDSGAVVDVERFEGDPESFLIPGFWPTRYNVIHEEMRLVLEAGGWKVVVP